MEQLRSRVVALDRRAARAIDPHRDVPPNARCVLTRDEMNPGVAGFPRVLDFPRAGLADHLAAVPDLSAHFGIKNGIIENDALSITEIDDRFNISAGMIVVIAEKIGRGLFRCVRDLDHALLLRLTPAIALFRHQLLEPFGVDREPTLPRHQLGEVERETIGIVKLKDVISGKWRNVRNGPSGVLCFGGLNNHLPIGRTNISDELDVSPNSFHKAHIVREKASRDCDRRYAVEQLGSDIESLVKGFLLAFERALDLRLLSAQLGEEIAHRQGEDLDQLIKERFVEA